ncbi:MAG: alpha-xylosidase [Clostridiales bacterium]|nr:alpha-xylosidase [Clostridiales bacterium]
MKFTEGLWTVKENFNAEYAREIRDIRKSQNLLTMYCPFRTIEFRYHTLNLGLITIEAYSPLQDCISIRLIGHKGGKRNIKKFEWELKNIDIRINENGAELTSGSLTMRAQKKPFNISFFADDKKLTGYMDKSLSIMTDKHTKTRYLVNGLELDVGECIYGGGERFTPFIKNGQSIDIWNVDGGTASDMSYKNVPFFMSSKGYGIFVNTPDLVSFEIGSEKVEETQFSVADEELEYVIIYGKTPADILDKYTQLTGRPALLPPWSYGLWLSTSFTTNYDEKTVNFFIDEMQRRQIPLSIFHFDCFWMKEFEWTSLVWDKDAFPDPKGMLDRLRKKGLKICVWINPYIAQKTQMFEEGLKNGYFLKRADGRVYQRDEWQAGMAIVDFTNPQACKWYSDKLEQLIDMGVDAFKTDFGEKIPEDAVYYDGSDPRAMHNYYSYLYNACVFELLQRKKGISEAIVFARSACAGGQKFPVHWGGDCNSTYNSMAESLRGGLSLMCSGFGYWSHDIGGFENNSPPDIYKRWVAFGLLSSHSRLHGSGSYRVPWDYDEEACDVLRFFTNLKCSLMPYIYQASIITHQKGTPIMRPMFFEFDEPTCKYLDRQYMFGKNILVAPVLSKDNWCEFYLPEGEWVHYLSCERLQGGKWYKKQYDFFSLPMYVRPDSIIPKGSVNDRPDYDYIADTVYEIFNLQSRAECVVSSYDQKRQAKVSAQRDQNVINIITQGDVKYILLNGITNAEVQGAQAKASERGLMLEAKSNNIKVVL